MSKPDVRNTERRILGRDVQNEGKYEKACKICGGILLMAKMRGPHRFGWWAFDQKPIDQAGIRYYVVHDCRPVPASEKSDTR